MIREESKKTGGVGGKKTSPKNQNFMSENRTFMQQQFELSVDPFMHFVKWESYYLIQSPKHEEYPETRFGKLVEPKVLA